MTLCVICTNEYKSSTVFETVRNFHIQLKLYTCKNLICKVNDLDMLCKDIQEIQNIEHTQCAIKYFEFSLLYKHIQIIS